MPTYAYDVGSAFVGAGALDGPNSISCSLPGGKAQYVDENKFDKKVLKKAKKLVDKPGFRWYISQAPEGAAPQIQCGAKNFSRNRKIFLDNLNAIWYISQADTREGDGAGCTLKIEQCKKKLMQISTRKGFLTAWKQAER